MGTTYPAATEPQAEQIVIVATVGHDDQGEYSDIAYCAVRIKRGALEPLRKSLDFVAVHKDAFGLYGVDFETPDGIDARFFSLDSEDDQTSLELTRALKDNARSEYPQASQVIYRGPEAEQLWDWAEEAEKQINWAVSGLSLKVYTQNYFFLETNYKWATGGVQTPELHFDEIESRFEELPQPQPQAPMISVEPN